MFTGIVEGVGRVTDRIPTQSGARLVVDLTGTLAGGTPLRKDAEFGPVGDEAADARFAVAVRESASEFANAHRAKSTGKEHEESTSLPPGRRDAT